MEVKVEIQAVAKTETIKNDIYCSLPGSLQGLPTLGGFILT